GIPVVSELELAFQLSKAPFIAVTGTNGKSTTTTLIGNFLSLAGWDVIVGGNIGIPLVEKAYNAKKEQLIVAEVSSFQLELVKHFRPYISLLLNISSDHLDRHGSLENYLNYKCRIFTQQKKGDYVLINYDDPLLMSIVDKIEADVLFFSSRAQLKNGIFLHNNAIYYKNGSSHCEICNIQDIPLQGEHNLKNIMAAMLVALIYKVPSHSILESLHNFKTLRHRMEFVTDIEGVYFIDDSKGTNPDAVMAALNTFKEPVILIAGGVDKKLDFSELCKFIARRVKGLILIGTTSDILYNYCSQNGLLQIMRASTIEDAVKRAYSIAEKGDVVLLSPGGASFDMFKNADDRGDKFIQAVKNLKNRIVR
ncbi:MAG TPA: UDP-N-acetylmuramoyl-L-alanine--D-glutamate ligase, partial [Candidatus Eremiobacteraeota bacterium]|nr:UDP-N-acetylmuramoyl-L-alanine--D-glutamate ligase [Candidatus Eremiobacteraeota bacterium]